MNCSQELFLQAFSLLRKDFVGLIFHLSHTCLHVSPLWNTCNFQGGSPHAGDAGFEMELMIVLTSEWPPCCQPREVLPWDCQTPHWIRMAHCHSKMTAFSIQQVRRMKRKRSSKNSITLAWKKEIFWSISDIRWAKPVLTLRASRNSCSFSPNVSFDFGFDPWAKSYTHSDLGPQGKDIVKCSKCIHYLHTCIRLWWYWGRHTLLSRLQYCSMLSSISESALSIFLTTWSTSVPLPEKKSKKCYWPDACKFGFRECEIAAEEREW